MLTRHQISQIKWEAMESGNTKRWTHKAILDLIEYIESNDRVVDTLIPLVVEVQRAFKEWNTLPDGFPTERLLDACAACGDVIRFEEAGIPHGMIFEEIGTCGVDGCGAKVYDTPVGTLCDNGHKNKVFNAPLKVKGLAETTIAVIHKEE
jgi:hypothetical protein